MFCYPYRDILHAFLRLLFRSSRVSFWLTLHVLGDFRCHSSSVSQTSMFHRFWVMKYFLVCFVVTSIFVSGIFKAKSWLNSTSPIRSSLTAHFWGHGFATAPNIAVMFFCPLRDFFRLVSLSNLTEIKYC